MNCPNCQTQNPEAAKFCMNCGTALALVCPSCATELPAAAKFCFNCGHQMEMAVAATSTPAPAAPAPDMPVSAPHAVPSTVAPEPDLAPGAGLERFIPQELLAKLQTARTSGAMVGERRIVTMLFCDVKGSTEAAGQLDPEEWAEIINGAFAFMIEPVYKYEGTLARLMGDAILAFFGAPIAHEDDPQRAVLAALEIVDGFQTYQHTINQQWGLDLTVRVGINTGLVVVGAVGSDLRMEYSALGDAINLAARMEQTAQPGTIQVAEATYKLVAPLFDFEALGNVEVKGKAEPVPVYRALRAKTEPGRLRGIQGLESPLVGRESELQQVRAALYDLEQGRGGILSLVAEAGLGKSRLVAEARQLPAGPQGTGWRWLEGRSLSYETNTPYAPFVELFTASFDLQPDQTAEEKYAAIRRQVEIVPTDQPLAPFLAALLGIPPTGADIERVRFLEPPSLRQAIFQAVGSYLEALAIQRPVALVLDDVHWIDPSSLELLQTLLPLADRVPLLLITLFRPRRQEPSWQFHEMAERDYAHRYRALFLQPLQTNDARQLVANLLHIEDLPASVRALILEKAEGNPFFVEEVIRSLLDAGLVVQREGHWHATRAIENISVPDTLAAVITSRLDRLDEELRSVLQSAAVIGRQFKFDTLNAIHPSTNSLERLLVELQRRELIREKARLPDRIFMFKHVLTQEATYNSLLLRARREIHLRVAGVLERTTPDAVTDLAHHYLEARQPVRALPYLVAAGEQAGKAYATEEALRFFEQALELPELAQDLDLVRRTYEGMGSALSFANEMQRAVNTYQDMLAVGEQKGDFPIQVSALNKLAYIYATRLGEFEEAGRLLADADRRARIADDKAGLTEMGLIHCMMCTAVADFDGVIDHLNEMVSVSKELGSKEKLTMGYAHIAASQVFLLRFDEAQQTFAEGLALCREIGDRLHEGILLSEAGAMCLLVQGKIEEARAMAEEGLSISQHISDVAGQVYGYRMLGMIAHQTGEYEEAIDYFQGYLDTSRQVGQTWFEAEALCLLGTAYLDISTDLLERVFGFHSKAVEVLEQPGGAMLGATSWAELGFCARAAGNPQYAVQYFQKGLENPTITMNLERPRLLAGAALTTLDLDEPEKAQSYVDLAQRYAHEHSLVYLYPLVYFVQGCVAEACGDNQKALHSYLQAENTGGSLGMRPLIWQARAHAARVLEARGKADEAAAKRAAAKTVIDAIAARFQDQELQTIFVTYAQNKLQ